ncbi:hypothetical protein N9M26_04630 [Alphaproteobacteria bacterium]|nr:hypothetical protein [Alphaproteobacteria bacterium]
MVYRLLLFVLIFIIKTAYSNIIYDKNNILITDIEMNSYLNLYKNNLGNNISKNEVIKNIVIIKNTINFLQNNNPNFLSNLDILIEKEYTKEIFNDQVRLNYIRFQKIRNEFISEYFNKDFDIKDLNKILSNFDNLRIPISKNDCLTIEKLHYASNDEQFVKNFFENLKKNQRNFEITIDNEIYNTCINTKLFSNLEKEIIKYIQNKTEKDFNDFIYGKTN